MPALTAVLFVQVIVCVLLEQLQLASVPAPAGVADGDKPVGKVALAVRMPPVGALLVLVLCTVTGMRTPCWPTRAAPVAGTLTETVGRFTVRFTHQLSTVTPGFPPSSVTNKLQVPLPVTGCDRELANWLVSVLLPRAVPVPAGAA